MEKKELLYIVISSFILTVIWICSNVYHAYATSTIDSLLTIQITPISADFDMPTIQKIRNRIKISPEDTILLPPSPTPTITPEPTGEITPPLQESSPTPISSESGALESNP